MTYSGRDNFTAGPIVVVAPDKFKGSMSAARAANAIASGIRRGAPTAHIIEHPVADGGEGTVDMLLAHGFAPVECQATGPMGSPVRATYAVRDDIAVMEMASVAGLALVGPDGPSARTAIDATTFGVGELIRHAIDGGASRIVLGIGGSATTDGGSGAVTAVGGRILTAEGRAVPFGGMGLLQAAELSLDSLDSRMREIDLVIACDVDNPLTGSDGAAAVYGPQKGAGSYDIVELDRALIRWSAVVAEAVGHDVSGVPGAGAAGGLAFGLAAVLSARLVSGIEFLLHLANFDEVIRQADLIIVGEGSLDAQSLRGKGPIGVARIARTAGVPVVALTGRNLIDEGVAHDAGLDCVYALSEIEADEKRSMANAEQLLEATAERVANDWLATR